MDDKITIRSEFLTRRRSLSPDDVRVKSAAITARLVQLPEFAQATTLLIYVASKDNEVDTKPLILDALGAAKTVLVPCAGPDGLLTCSVLCDWKDLERGRFGILEPRPDCLRPATPPADAPVIVPGIAFSPAGHRIGYGKGNYDRFLAAHSGPKIGLAYDAQIVTDIPVDAHDVPMDHIVSESAVYDCRP